MKLGTATVTAIYLGTTSIVSAYLGATQVFGGASAFTPLDLFSTGSQGIWLDPSDLTTMFSDRAGTTAVTTPGTVVGLRLDKSKGLTLGAELVDIQSATVSTTGDVTATFNTSTSTFTRTGGTTGEARLSASIAGDAAKLYLVSVSYSGSFASLSSTGTFLTTGQRISPTSGTISAILIGSTIFRIATFTAGNGLSVTIDNISVRELQGNHAVAPTDAARPVYGVEPKGGRRNLLLSTDTLATQSLTVTAVAHTLAFTGTGTVTLSGASTAGPLVGTGAGDRVSLTFTPTAASLTLTVSGSVTLGQLELGSTATAYQKVVTAYNVTESGVATCHYVQFDGSDDSMSTAAIDFTATDKMSVFAGIMKGSNSAAVFIESSLNSNLNAGTFNVITDASYNYGTHSTSSTGSGYSGNTSVAYSPPHTAVLSGGSDLSEATATAQMKHFRLNGLSATNTSFYSASTAQVPFGNYPLFIGRRNNASLPFNGRDFGILVVGKAVTPTEITDTETWLAAKTSGVVLP